MPSERLPRNFIKSSISPRLKCPICLQVYYKPRRLFCGHTFCKPCLQDLCDTQHYKNPQHVNSCPLCRTPIDFYNIQYDLFLIRIVDELEVSCPVYGCSWKGENHMLDTHYNLECKMKSLVRKVARGTKEFDCEIDEEIERDQGHKENASKAGVFSKSKVSNLGKMMEISKQSLVEQNYQSTLQPQHQPPRKRMITCATQTPPVRILPVKRIKRPIQTSRPTQKAFPHITPVNGYDPIPANLLKNHHKNLATRIKQQNRMSAASSSEEMRDVHRIYAEMDFSLTEEPSQQGIDFSSATEPIIDVDA